MTALVQGLYEKTTELVKRLEVAEYEEFTALVELREEALHELQRRKGLSEEEKRMLRQIGEFDTAIVARMDELKQEAAQGSRRMAQSRHQQKMYQAAYTAESFFFDKRK